MNEKCRVSSDKRQKVWGEGGGTKEEGRGLSVEGKETRVSSIECRVKHLTLDTRHSELGIVASDQKSKGVEGGIKVARERKKCRGLSVVLLTTHNR